MPWKANITVMSMCYKFNLLARIGEFCQQYYFNIYRTLYKINIPHSLHISCHIHNLLQLIGQEFELETALGLCQALTKHLEEAEAQKAVNENW